jgi:hypothetical protein
MLLLLLMLLLLVGMVTCASMHAFEFVLEDVDGTCSCC